MTLLGKSKTCWGLILCRPGLLSDYGPQEVSWPDEGLFQRLEDRSDPADLPVGDAEEMGREVKSRPSQSETILAPMEYLSRQNQHQYHHKASEKR